MNLSQGFPLYDNIAEIISKYKDIEILKLIKTATHNKKLIPEPGDAVIKIIGDKEREEIVIIDKKYCEDAVSDHNKDMIIDIIESNHIPTILQYLSLSGENINIIKYNFSIFNTFVNKIIERKIIGMNNIPNGIKNFIFNNNKYTIDKKHSVIILTFPEGIKNDNLFTALLPFINNISPISNNKSGLAKDGYIEILLYPSNDYDRINHLISRIFDAI